MNKEQILQSLKTLIQGGQVTKNEVLALLGESEIEQPKKFSINVVNILYGIGGLVILAGIITLVAQNWIALPSFARILVTLGMAIVLYISSTLVSKNYNILAQILMALSMVLFPLGIGVTLFEMDVNPGMGTITFILVLLTALAWITYYLINRMVVGTLFTIAFGTLTAYSAVAYLLSLTSAITDGKIFLYLTMALGISHGALGYMFRNYEYSHKKLGQLLYLTGTLGLLVPAVSLGGIWDVLFVVVVMATFYLSVNIHSRGMLILSALFLIGYIFKITAIHFAGSLTWPIALILIGILTIVIAIVTFRINQKYFNNAEQLQSPGN